MSKAEERALEKYPYAKVCREKYIEGYHQAEKDLALTWMDMMLIHKCIKDAMNFHLYKMLEGEDGQKVVYEEVLNRFNKQKEDGKVQNRT